MTIEPIDFNDLHLRAGNDDTLAREVLGDLIAIVERERPQLREACRTRAFDDAARTTHRLRGALLAVGAGWAARRAERLESVANEHRDEDIENAFGRFEGALDDAVAAIHRFLGRS